MSINYSSTDQKLLSLAKFYVETEGKLKEAMFLMESYNYSEGEELIQALKVKNIQDLLELISDNINKIMKQTEKEEIKDIKSFCEQILGGIGANIMLEKSVRDDLQGLKNFNVADWS